MHAANRPDAGAPRRDGAATRVAILAFGFATYAIFLATFLAMIAFLSGRLDRTALGLPAFPPAQGSGAVALAVAVNAGCLGLFALQHTIMARPGFKARWTQLVHPALERSIFVLVTCLVLVLMVAQWRPIAGHAWDVGPGPAAAVLWAVTAIGWGLVLYSTFLIDHFELFGLSQVMSCFRGSAAPRVPFKEHSLYRFVRHPMMIGFLLAFWPVPVASWDRLLFSVAATGYILFVGVVFEERDLRSAYGKAYDDYSRRVPRILPRLRPAPRPAATPTPGD